jgi:hypothetical protein
MLIRQHENVTSQIISTTFVKLEFSIDTTSKTQTSVTQNDLQREKVEEVRNSVYWLAIFQVQFVFTLLMIEIYNLVY